MLPINVNNDLYRYRQYNVSSPGVEIARTTHASNPSLTRLSPIRQTPRDLSRPWFGRAIPIDTHSWSPGMINRHTVVASVNELGRVNVRTVNFDRNGNRLQGMGRNTAPKFQDVNLMGQFRGTTQDQVLKGWWMETWYPPMRMSRLALLLHRPVLLHRDHEDTVAQHHQS